MAQERPAIKGKQPVQPSAIDSEVWVNIKTGWAYGE
jgi:hypothetical protein